MDSLLVDLKVRILFNFSKEGIYLWIWAWWKVMLYF